MTKPLNDDTVPTDSPQQLAMRWLDLWQDYLAASTLDSQPVAASTLSSPLQYLNQFNQMMAPLLASSFQNPFTHTPFTQSPFTQWFEAASHAKSPFSPFVAATGAAPVAPAFDVSHHELAKLSARLAVVEQHLARFLANADQPDSKPVAETGTKPVPRTRKKSAT